MKSRIGFVTIVLSVGLLEWAWGLDDFRRYGGPPCSSISNLVPADADRAAIDRIRYIVAGSRYIFYRVASSQPNYSTMTEDELLETICFSRNSSTTLITTTRPYGVFTFGQFLPVMISTRPGVYIEAPLGPDIIRDLVTLTDEKTFAILVSCWNGPGVDTSSYVVATRTSQLPDSATWKRITRHLASLGFRNEDMLIARNENCSWRENPALEEWTKGSTQRSNWLPESGVVSWQEKVPHYNQRGYGRTG